MERQLTIPMAQARLRVLISALLLAGLLVTLVPAVSRAASFTVTNLNDSGSGSLRQALVDAKAVDGADTITFQDGLTGTITVTSQLEIDSDVTIQGPGPDLLTISGGGTTRVFNMTGGVTATIDGLTITNGLGTDAGGGAIQVVSSSLTLTNSVLTANDAYYGGAVSIQGGALVISNSTLSDNSASVGGAVYVEESTLQVENSTVERNTGNDGGAGLYITYVSPATIVDSTFAGNMASTGCGGGVSTASDLTIINSTFSDNPAGWGGGICNNGGHLSVSGSSFSDNTAYSNATGAGGGIYSYGSSAISDSAFVGNDARLGGGIFYDAAITMTANDTISNSTFEQNSATDRGGAVYGAVPLNIVNSTFSGNTAKLGGGFASTFDAQATGNTIANSTFSTNSATDAGSSIATWRAITLTGSIFADSGTDSCSILADNNGIGEIIDGGYNLSTEATCVSAATSLANTDPLLGPLADNGGVTQTYALLPGSLALDRIPVGTLGCGTTLATDQRGITRPQGTACDIGAVESIDTTAPVITPTVGGTLGTNGWYTSDVSVTWSVVDAESSVSS